MCKEPAKKEQPKQEKPAKPEGSNWNTSTPPGYREEMQYITAKAGHIFYHICHILFDIPAFCDIIFQDMDKGVASAFCVASQHTGITAWLVLNCETYV